MRLVFAVGSMVGAGILAVGGALGEPSESKTARSASSPAVSDVTSAPPDAPPPHSAEGRGESPSPVAAPPVAAPRASPPPDPPAAPREAAPEPDPSAPSEESDSSPEPEPETPEVVEPFRLLGSEVPPGERRRLGWQADSHLAGLQLDTPVLVAHGAQPGPVLCLTSAIHGDELNGIEIVRRVFHSVDPRKLSGTIVGVPVVNLVGFQRGSRYLSDRRDLNRYFPGNASGSLASRVANSFFDNVVRQCSRLVDLHTGSFHRSNLPQLRADLTDPEVREMTRGFGGISVLHSRGGSGTLRRAATAAGIPTVTIEAGEPMRLQTEEVEQGVRGIETLMDKLGMATRVRFWPDPQPVYYESYWVRADRSGILLGQVELGDRVSSGTVLGTVVDPITNVKEELTTPYDGRVLGMALNQVVMPGFAAFRIGIETSEDEAARDAETTDAASEDEDEETSAEDGEAEHVVESPEEEREPSPPDGEEELADP